MVRCTVPERHLCPSSFVLFVDAVELLRVEPPRPTKRVGIPPVDLTQCLRDPGEHTLRVDASEHGTSIAEFVLCVVQTRPDRVVGSILADCLKAPEASEQDARRLWTLLHAVESPPEKEGIQCVSPLVQSLICPLTCARMRIPARGRQCQHLRCFDLEAYLVTSASTSFHRRWHCPVCNQHLLPSGLAICRLTKRLLQELGEVAVSAPLDFDEPLLEMTADRECSPAVGDTCACSAGMPTCQTIQPAAGVIRRASRRWRSGTLTPAGEGSGDQRSGVSGFGLHVKACAAGAWGIHQLRHTLTTPSEAPRELD